MKEFNQKQVTIYFLIETGIFLGIIVGAVLSIHKGFFFWYLKMLSYIFIGFTIFHASLVLLFLIALSLLAMRGELWAANEIAQAQQGKELKQVVWDLLKTTVPFSLISIYLYTILSL